MTDAGLMLVATVSVETMASVAGPEGVVMLMVLGRLTSTVISWLGAVAEVPLVISR
jgi:hypothetical protein